MKKITIIVASMFLIASCSDILDKIPLDKISDSAVWNDEDLTEAYLVELYARMFVLKNESTTTGTNNLDAESWFPVFCTWDITDEGTVCWSSESNYSYKFGGLRIGGGLLEWWGYTQMREIHIFMENLPETPLSEDLKSLRMAEARFLRAYNYYSMVRRYGGVPIITKAQGLDDPEDELYPPRNTEKEVYDFIISEMDAIVNDLNEPSATDAGRPSKSAAIALKCRAALYAGSIAQFGNVQLNGVVGIPADQADSYYRMAYESAGQIINSGWHQLYNQDADKVANFKNIFLNEGNSEVIFVRPYNDQNALAGGNGWCVDFMQCPKPNAWGGGNQTGPYLEMVEEFEYIDGRPGKLDRAAIQQGLWTTDELWGDKDPRFFATIWTLNTPWKGGFVDKYSGLRLPDGTVQLSDSYGGVLANGTNSGGTGFGVMKYLNEDHDNLAGSNSGWPTSWQDWVIFRYGEILLNYAEAAFELGRDGEALNVINQIRNRAGIAPLTSIDRAKIRHERKVELAFEGHRYWDVRRWRTAVTELSGHFSGLRYYLDYESYMKGENKYQLYVVEQYDGTTRPLIFYDYHYYLPITLARTANNPKLVENPGYE